MDNFDLENSKKRLERRMISTPESIRYEMKDRARDLVEFAKVFKNEKAEAALAAYAWSVRVSFSRLREIYYGNARRIEGWETDNIRALYQQFEPLIQQHKKNQAAVRAAMSGDGHVEMGHDRDDAVASLADPNQSGPVRGLASSIRSGQEGEAR